jgi:hypothetical protein
MSGDLRSAFPRSSAAQSTAWERLSGDTPRSRRPLQAGEALPGARTFEKIGKEFREESSRPFKPQHWEPRTDSKCLQPAPLVAP